MGYTLVPQAISNSSDDMVYLEERLLDLGYEEYNLNLGCPSGTVVSKKRGAGFLAEPEELNSFLDQVFSKTKMKLSIKTRVGLKFIEEWEELLNIFLQYPIAELIIHPRLGSQMYKGTPYWECFKMAYDKASQIQLVYNGDIVDLESFNNIKNQFPHIDHYMIGRGALKNPLIFEELSGEKISDALPRIKAFHDYIYEGYTRDLSGEKDTIMHIKGIWYYLDQSFPGKAKAIKRLKKKKNPAEYKSIVNNEIFG